MKSELEQLLMPYPKALSSGTSGPNLMRIQLAVLRIALAYESLSREVAQVEAAAIRERIHADLVALWFDGADPTQIALSSDNEWAKYWLARTTNVSARS
jgi:hypothetical protein